MPRASPLLAAILHGDVATTARLVDAAEGAPDLIDAEPPNISPLFLAAQMGSPSAVSLLLGARARADAPATVKCATPLLIACQLGHAEVAKILLRAGAKSEDALPGDGATPLFVACQNGHRTVAAALLAARAAVGRPCHSGASPLFVAVQNGHADVASLLLFARAHPDQPKRTGATPLFVACERGRVAEAGMLIAAGADCNRRKANGATPLHVASYHRQPNVVAALLMSRAEPSVADRRGGTPMFYAGMRGCLASVQLLSLFGADRIVPFALRDVGLEAATRLAGCDDVSTWLSESRDWNTVLHHFSCMRALDVYEMLRLGADLHASARADGPTPLTIARAMHAAAGPALGATGRLVLIAAGPWTPASHALFPARARARAVEVLRMGHLVSRAFGCGGALLDAWLHGVMPLVVLR